MTSPSYKIPVTSTLKEMILSLKHAINTSGGRQESERASIIKTEIHIEVNPILDGMYRIPSISTEDFTSALERIITNLGNNSVKYGKYDGQEVLNVLVNVDWVEDEDGKSGQLIVKVKDNGPGFFKNFDSNVRMKFATSREANDKAKQILTGMRSQGAAASDETGSGIGGSSLNDLRKQIGGKLIINTGYVNLDGLDQGIKGTETTLIIPEVFKESRKVSSSFDFAHLCLPVNPLPVIRTHEEMTSALELYKFHVIVVDDQATNTRLFSRVLTKKLNFPHDVYDNKTMNEDKTAVLSRSEVIKQIISKIADVSFNHYVILYLDGDLTYIPDTDNQYPGGFTALTIIQEVQRNLPALKDKIRYVSYSASEDSPEDVFVGAIDKQISEEKIVHSLYNAITY